MTEEEDGIAAADELIVRALVQRGGIAPAVARESVRIMAAKAAAGDADMERALRDSRVAALHGEADFIDAYLGIMQADPEA